jgi:hypothetical protein
MPSPSTPLQSRFSVDEVTPVTLPGLPAEKETDTCAYSVRGAGSVASWPRSTRSYRRVR